MRFVPGGEVGARKTPAPAENRVLPSGGDARPQTGDLSHRAVRARPGRSWAGRLVPQRPGPRPQAARPRPRPPGPAPSARAQVGKRRSAEAPPPGATAQPPAGAARSCVPGTWGRREVSAG